MATTTDSAYNMIFLVNPNKNISNLLKKCCCYCTFERK